MFQQRVEVRYKLNCLEKKNQVWSFTLSKASFLKVKLGNTKKNVDKSAKVNHGSAEEIESFQQVTHSNMITLPLCDQVFSSERQALHSLQAI